VSTSSSSTLGTMAFIIVALGIALFAASFGPLRQSWSSRLKKAHGWFYHPDETAPIEETTEESEDSSPRTLLDKIDPRGFDYSIYKDRE
jgi:hypothetical protein